MTRSFNLAALVGALAHGGVIACSIPEANAKIASTSVRYDFTATVIDEEIADDPRIFGKKMVAALRLRVIQASGREPADGAVVAMGYQYTGSLSSTCKRETRSLTLREWSAGTRVRVKSNDLYSAESISTAD